MTGFQQTETADQLKVQAVIKRLTPAARRQDTWAIAQGISQMSERYGNALVDTALAELCRLHPWMWERAHENLPPDEKELLHSEAYETMAKVLTDAGLRLEDNLRVTDEGVALTKQAIAVFADTGFPEVDAFGEGNETLDDVGLGRDPFWHHLSDFQGAGERAMMNLWMAASFIINGANGWIADDDGSRKPSRNGLRNAKRLAAVVAPTLDTEKLLYRTRYDDRELLKACEILHRAMESRPDILQAMASEAP